MIPPHCPLQGEAKDHEFCNGDCTSAKILIKKFPYSFSELRKIPTAMGDELPCCRCLKALFELVLKYALSMVSGVSRCPQLCGRVNIWPVSSHCPCHGREMLVMAWRLSDSTFTSFMSSLQFSLRAAVHSYRIILSECKWIKHPKSIRMCVKITNTEVGIYAC